MESQADLFQVGGTASLTKVISDNEIQAYADLVGDHNPVHLVDEYAANTRFKGRIAHGGLAVGLISAVLGNRLPGPGTIYLSQKVQFLAPIRPGDRLTATVEIVDIRLEKPIFTLRTFCINQTNELIVDGEAVVMLDRQE